MSSFESGGFPSSVGSELPGLLPPAGVTSNLINPPSRGDAYTSVATTIIATMIILVTNRQYTKYFIIQKLGWDDLTCLVAELAALASYINFQYQVSAGHVGTHQWNVPLSYTMSKKWLVPAYISVILGPPTMMFTKLTFYLVYLQVFKPLKWLRICVYAGASITTMFYVGVEMYLLVSVTPRKGQSLASVALSSAQFKPLRTSVPIASVGLGTDVYLLVLPIAAVMQLQLPTRRKIGVILIFSTGLAACVASALSVYYRVLLNKSADYTWNILPVNICTVAEMGIGLCCLSMPALSKMLAYHLPPYKELSSWVGTHYTLAKSTITKRSLKEPTRLGRLFRMNGSKTSGSDDSYLDLEKSTDVHIRTGAPRCTLRTESA